jgi:hypothetical protein
MVYSVLGFPFPVTRGKCILVRESGEPKGSNVLMILLYKDYPTLAKHNRFITGSNVFHLNNNKSSDEMEELIRESKFGLCASEFLVCTFPWKVAVAEKS